VYDILASFSGKAEWSPGYDDEVSPIFHINGILYCFTGWWEDL